MSIRQRIPSQLKAPFRVVRTIRQRATLGRGLRGIQHGDFSDRTLQDLRDGWGDDGFLAFEDLLQAVIEFSRKESRPILEIGSGLSTLVLAALGKEATTFEHEREFYDQTLSHLKRYNLKGDVRLAPLKSYGEFDWYTVPDHLGQFGLIIADGPPGTTKGGRYGLAPVLRDHFKNNAVILLDDVQRPSERDTLERWQREFGYTYTTRTDKHGHAIGIVKTSS